MNQWYSMSTGETGGTIDIFDEIGGYGISAVRFKADLDALGPVDRIDMRIMSPGGSVIEGNAIFNMLTQHPAHIVAHVDFAASMASIIAMAADEIHIAENGYLMIHNPWTYAAGDADDLRSMADVLDQMRDSAIKAYARHTDLSADEIQQMMDDETWMTGQDAFDMGFATSVSPSIKAAASLTGAGLAACDVPAGAQRFLKLEGNDEDTDGTAGSDGSDGTGGAVGDGIVAPQSAAVDGAALAEQIKVATSAAAEARAELTAKLAELADVNAKLAEVTGAVSLRDEQIATLTAELAGEKAKLESITGGFRFRPDTGQPVDRGAHPFQAIVAGLVESGMDYDKALLKASKDSPDTYRDFLQTNTRIKR